MDAGFIWTEPHSKRIKVKLTIQKEVRVLGRQGGVVTPCIVLVVQSIVFIAS